MVVAGPGSGKVVVLLHFPFDLHQVAVFLTDINDGWARTSIDERGNQASPNSSYDFYYSCCFWNEGSNCKRSWKGQSKGIDYQLSRTTDFLIYGHGQQRRAVIEVVRLLENGKQKKSFDASESNGPFVDVVTLANVKDTSKKWQQFVMQAKAAGRQPEEFHHKGDDVGSTILSNYDGILRSCNALDYHDLISCSVKLLTDYPEVVGDEDQSIFSFNGADISGFDSFRKDFPNLKEILLNRNYRSTRCIVEAASSLSQNNKRRCQLKKVLADNSSGEKITVKECHNENAQCAFVIDKIFEDTADDSDNGSSLGNITILYRRQVSGKVFQAAFRSRKISFNVHGVAFYRKKVIKVILALLKTALPGCDDGPFRQAFKTLLPFEKEERKKVIEHVDEISTIRKCSFISAAKDVFNAKISGTFKRSQLSHGRKVLVTLEIIMKLVQREQSLSTLVTSVGNLIPQVGSSKTYSISYLLEQRAVLDNEGGKLLNEDNDVRSVLDFLLDDVTDFLSTKSVPSEDGKAKSSVNSGCLHLLKAFCNDLKESSSSTFRSFRFTSNSGLRSMQISDRVFWLLSVNESEIPFLHEHNGIRKESRSSVEEERRLLFVGMTRARKKLYMLYVLMDSYWQMLQPSHFLKEIPCHQQDAQDDMNLEVKKAPDKDTKEASHVLSPNQNQCNAEPSLVSSPSGKLCVNGRPVDNSQMKADLMVPMDGESYDGNIFLRRFGAEDRVIVSHIFRQWAKKQAFKDPKRPLDKVGFVVDERLRMYKNKHKDVFQALKSSLKSEDAFWFAKYVLRWEQIPPEKRAHLMREKQEHFQKLRMETAMNSSSATPKQIAYLRSLGCTVPESQLHASRLIEQYKSV
ncbi:hypothetical protein Drorol1_Dr00025952 [Drosera rotundifolia]